MIRATSNHRKHNVNRTLQQKQIKQTHFHTHANTHTQTDRERESERERERETYAARVLLALTAKSMRTKPMIKEMWRRRTCALSPTKQQANEDARETLRISCRRSSGMRCIAKRRGNNLPYESSRLVRIHTSPTSSVLSSVAPAADCDGIRRRTNFPVVAVLLPARSEVCQPRISSKVLKLTF